MKKLSLTCCLLLAAYCGLAQTDSLPSPQPPIDDAVDQAIEDLIINTESEDQVDYSFLTDYLEDLRLNPINLNTASYEELMTLAGMNAIHANQLLRHIRDFGKLTSIYELQAVRGFSPELIRQFLPFVSVQDSKLKDINPGVKHAKGPSFVEIQKGLKFELLQRMVWFAEEARGYTDPDTTFRDILNEGGEPMGIDTILSSRYAGSPYRIYTRFRARFNQNVSIGFVGEKDPGEVFDWQPENRLYGYDFLSGHVSLSGFGRLKNLVIGDYTITAGQGMVLSRGLGFGKGVQVINSLKMPARGIQPYSSVNENQFMRGAAATYAIGDIYVTGFVSRSFRDASLINNGLSFGQGDTLNAEAVLATNLQTSGLHRTLSELKNRGSIGELLYGGRVEYRSPTLTIGSTHYLQRFDGDLLRPANDYSLFNFVGNQNYLNSLDFDWIWQNFNLFGEFARSQSGGTGATLGIMGSIAPTVDVSLLGRRYSKDFHTSRAYVFAERPTAAQNETGLYLGLRIAPNPRWTLNTYFDQYYFPWNRFQAGFPSRGWEFLTQLEYKPKRGTLVYLRFRSDNKQINADEVAEGPALEYLVWTQKLQTRLHFQTTIERDLQLRTRLEWSQFTQESQVSTGWLLYQDVSWRLGFKYRITARYALFDVPEYDARIYAYENDILGFFSIPPYYRKGNRYYLIFNWKPTRKIEFWARVAQSRFQDQRTIGSGLEQIAGPNRTEFKLQVRLKW
jgi:hypothetical protein